MKSSNFDLELFIRSFEKAGAVVQQTSGQGRLEICGEEKEISAVLNSVFDNENNKDDLTVMVGGKMQARRTDFSAPQTFMSAA